MNCLIAGASGLVGHELLIQLLADPNVTSVTSLGRSPQKRAHAKLHDVITNFERLEYVELPKSDVAFCCLGTTIKKAGSQEAFSKVDHDYVLNFAKAAQAVGVQSFIVISAMGADVNSKVFYSRVKGQVEQDLKNLNFQNLVILRPSLLLGERSERRTNEKVAAWIGGFLKPLFVGPLLNIRPIDAKDVAKAMKLAASKPRPLTGDPQAAIISNGELFAGH